ncbi:TonB-dependent receptor [Spongiimicrobium salis]|uniref:TonB-dependent receptor n=1 Tax=Spongiimicrobium salis TaxID=1667022 RepID=UPI00374CA9CD
MPKANSKHISLIFLLSFLFTMSIGKAQDSLAQKIPLISYLGELETRFDIKFSYVDSDIDGSSILPIAQNTLSEILKAIEGQTSLKIVKLNPRYYSIVKHTLVTICGRVLDNFEKNTIMGASVEVLDTKEAMVTDTEGYFKFREVAETAVLRIQYLGYKPMYVQANDLVKTPCAPILMSKQYQELSEVILYNFLTSGLSKQKDASIRLSTKEFGIIPGLIEPDILQTIQALPGIKSINETVSDINVRGGTNDQNLILWDGIKTYQSGHFFGLISAFNPYLVDKVDIVKNGTSVAYGDGVSSVINIQTKNEITSSFSGGGGVNLLSGDFYGILPITERLAFQFSARRSFTDFFESPTFNQFFDRVFQDTEIRTGQSLNDNIEREEDFFYSDFAAKVLYDINPTQKLRFSFLNSNNRLDYLERSTNTPRSTESTLDQTNISGGASLESNWSPDFSSLLNVYYTRYNLDAFSSSQNNLQQLFQNNQVIDFSIKLNTAYRFFDHLQWRNGYQFNEVGVVNLTDVSLPPFRSNNKGVIRTHALFSGLDYSSRNEKLDLRGGFRFNYIENLDSFKELIIEPRINLNYSFSKKIKATLLGEFKNQTTNQVIDLEQNFLGIEKRRWILSDGERLPITKSKQLSLGFTYDQKSLYIGLEGFYKDVDGISTSTQGFQNQNQFRGEIGGYTIKGLEFLINKKTARYSTWFSYTYNVNNYTFEDIVPPTFPNNLDTRHTLTFAGTYTYKKLKLGLGVNYRTGKPITVPLEGDAGIDNTSFPLAINFEPPNSSRLPNYLRVDASAIYNFDLTPGIKASLGASILNLFNRNNILETYFILNDEDEIERIENISLGITPNLSFRVSF